MQLDFNNLTAGQMWVMAIVLCYVGGLAFMAYLTAYFWWKNEQLKRGGKFNFYFYIWRKWELHFHSDSEDLISLQIGPFQIIITTLNF